MVSVRDPNLFVAKHSDEVGDRFGIFDRFKDVGNAVVASYFDRGAAGRASNRFEDASVRIFEQPEDLLQVRPGGFEKTKTVFLMLREGALVGKDGAGCVRLAAEQDDNRGPGVCLISLRKPEGLRVPVERGPVFQAQNPLASPLGKSRGAPGVFDVFASVVAVRLRQSEVYDVVRAARGVIVALGRGQNVVGGRYQALDGASIGRISKAQKGTDDRHKAECYQRLRLLDGKIRTVALPVQLKAHAELVDARLRELLPPETDVPSELHAAMRYACLAPGKRLRPALVLASAQAIGKDPLLALDAACAIEMTHAFSLIHDDLPALDNDELRRGSPTCWKQFGEAVAILAGDALFSLAFDTLAALPIEPVRVVASIRALTQATGSRGLVAGETIDILSEGRQIDAETLLRIHAWKTGALIAASCEIGAMVSGGSDDEVRALRGYGQDIGLAFQIADDVLNETSTEEQLGKAIGSDRERQKATYPAFYGLAESRRLAQAAAQRGVDLVRELPSPEFLEELARFSVERLS